MLNNTLTSVLVEILPTLTFIFCVRLMLSLVVGAFRGRV